MAIAVEWLLCRCWSGVRHSCCQPLSHHASPQVLSSSGRPVTWCVRHRPYCQKQALQFFKYPSTMGASSTGCHSRASRQLPTCYTLIDTGPAPGICASTCKVSSALRSNLLLLAGSHPSPSFTPISFLTAWTRPSPTWPSLTPNIAKVHSYTWIDRASQQPPVEATG
jgi:hypothetical protein